ncbi:DUF2254 domain-containing protein [Planomicrobium sp. Y74]|uniref:DUF2254 domain-containing protein n=1 Tax=Planomicrobium sp. Y74 TaxID=2478977 RepID=UPI000EF4DE66|nr:DUF2254 domain-containing protein [Planomicrobium sp. Y74]RLQ90144.1 DUF2254 domain-containing protein [Planomicrobium sp. Y74]
MRLKLLPWEIKKYFQMSKRQRKYEISLTLWHIPLLYIVVAIVIAIATIFGDMYFDLPSQSDFYILDFESTRSLVSTLISSVLLLSAFTLNILLILLTTFSGQFSPRMLQNFIADRQTQHYVGIFNGSFVYVLLMFLFMSNFQNNDFILVPIITVLLTFITAIIFLFFINHAIYWMQVHNITSNMKIMSEKIIQNELTEGIEKLKKIEADDLKEHFRGKTKEVYTSAAGYLQFVDFQDMVRKAQKEDIIIELHEKVGNFILSNNLLFSYWGEGSEEVDEEAYKDFFLFGNKELEIQDNDSAMSKLAEVAIKSINNGDPRSAINAVYQLANLMQTIDRNITFAPYLADSDGQVRVILQAQRFEDSLYRGFGMIRHYAKDDLPVIIEIISSLRMLASAAHPTRYAAIWHFAENTIVNVSESIIYDMERDLLLEKLYQLAKITENKEEYYKLEKTLKREDRS